MPFISYGGVCQSLTPPVVGLGPDQTVCANSIVTFNPVVTGGQPPYTYLWQSVGSNIICTTCRDASVAVAQNSTYVLKVTDASGGDGYDTINFIVAGTPYNFQVAATIPTTFCAGCTVTMSANANDSVSFQWNRNGSSIPGAVANTFTVSDSSGAYNLVYTEDGFCQATSNIIHLSFYDTAHVTITSIGSDTICVGGAVTLTAIAEGSGLSYAWLANDSNFNYAASAYVAVTAGVYRVIATNQAGCADTSEAVLVVASPNSAPVVSYRQFAGDTLCNNGAVINLTGGEPAGGYYSGSGVSNGVFDPNVGNIGLNFIYYSYTDNTGCGNSVFDTIDILLCTGIRSIDLESGLQLYPDPCTDRITIQSDILFQSNALISVYDIAGKRIYVNYSRQSDNKVSINISALATGCYSVQVMADDRVVSKRFIKLG